MPIYEYICQDCGKKSTFITLSVSAALDPKCKACGSARVRKLVSRVAVFRSEENRLEGLADPSNLAGLDEEDPKSVARWMKKMGSEMGEDLGPDFDREVDQAVEEAEQAKETGEEPGTGGGPGEESSGGDL